MASSPILGCIYGFAGNFAPRGFMLCQGQLLPISQYAALFSLLGTTYGGNGTSNFQLPDLRGRAAVSQGDGPGLDPVVLGEFGGATSATMTQNNMPLHNHTATAAFNCSADGRPGSDSPVGAVPDSGSGLTIYAAAPDGSKMNAGMATVKVAVAGNSIPFSTQNPYLGLCYIIATSGMFPSRG